ncbi:putative BlaI family transcriptional regulator [Streptomyces zinciresistens K42]|uniref:Putative BlaI family transcriptional regulator n=1 Tax=Streptomyces zinciresistens K42 TaxID=700597 RepID=G2GK80_9ACTN|nr:BlaI/MecI/CopY family transcriptional regulator [Streptomyces zinciresistens]EGX56101.1 putative BlaI family transcriptional regulator [Streptomyces zinciresistens K42]
MRVFGGLEAEIMRVVWRSAEPVAVQAIVDALGERRRLAYTTVMTVTERLREKGWLTRVRHGRAYRYSAARTADDYTAELMGQALQASSDRPGALMRFAGQLNDDEAAALRAVLNQPPAGPGPAGGN